MIMKKVDWYQTVKCPNCKENMELTKINHNKEIFQHNRPESTCLLAIEAECYYQLESLRTKTREEIEIVK